MTAKTTVDAQPQTPRNTTALNTLDLVDVSAIPEFQRGATELVVTALQTPGREINKEALTTLVHEMVALLPERLRAELLHHDPSLTGRMEQELERIFVKKDPLTPVEISEVSNIVAAMLIDMQNVHAHSRMTDSSMHPHNLLDKNGEPDDCEIDPANPKSRLAKRLTEYGIFVGSAATSWMGTSHYSGMFLQWLQKTLEYGYNANVQLASRETLAILAAVGISKVVLNVKRGIEQRAHMKNMHIFQATGDMIKDHRTGLVGLLAIAGASMVVVGDAATNVSGIFTGIGARRDMREQVGEFTKEIDHRVAKFRAQIIDLPPEIQARISTDIDQHLAKEADGDAVSQTAGKGPVYDAKATAWKEDSEAHNRLIDRAAGGDQLAKSLLQVINNADILDGKSLDQELEAIVLGAIQTLEAELAKVEEAKKKLDPSQPIEFIQKQLNLITGTKDDPNSGILIKCMQAVNVDLNGRLAAHFEKYNRLNSDLADATVDSGRYAGATKTKLEEYRLPNVEMDTARLVAGEIKYRTPTELAQTAIRDKNVVQGSFIIIMAMIIGTLLSHFDQLFFLRATRKGAQKDKAESERIRTQYIDVIKSGVVDVLSRVLNEGPFSKYLKSVDVDRGEIERCVDETLVEMAQEESQGRTWKDRWLPTRSEVVLSHNEYARAFLKLFTHPGKNEEDTLPLMRVMEKILPGMSKISGHKMGAPVLTAAQSQNDKKHREINAEVYRQKVEAEKLKISGYLNKANELASNIQSLEAVDTGIAGINAVIEEIKNAKWLPETEEESKMAIAKLIEVTTMLEKRREILEQKNKIEQLQKALTGIDAHIAVHAGTREVLDQEGAYYRSIVGRYYEIKKTATEMTGKVHLENQKAYTQLLHAIENKAQELGRRKGQLQQFEKDITTLEKQKANRDARRTKREQQDHEDNLMTNAITWYREDKELGTIDIREQRQRFIEKALGISDLDINYATLTDRHKQTIDAKYQELLALLDPDASRNRHLKQNELAEMAEVRKNAEAQMAELRKFMEK